MPVPAQTRNQLVPLLDAAWDAFLAGQDFNENFRVVVGGRTVKLRVFRNHIDHPDGFVVLVLFRPEGV